MANILYITPQFYVTSKHTGGMGTKTEALKNCWGLTHDIEIASEVEPEYAELYDVIVIELLGLRNDERLEERIEAFRSCDAPKVVYGSDSEIFRWSGKDLDALKEVVSLWIPNIEWQADYFRDFDLPVTEIVCEPVDCMLFRDSDKKEQRIIAGGAISYAKNSDFFVDLFSQLKEMDTGNYQTEYIGGHIWGGKPDAQDMRLRHEMKKVCDVFHGEVLPNAVAGTIAGAAVGVLCPHYETCNRFDQELMANGTARVCSQHMTFTQRPVAQYFDGTVQDCIDTLKEITEGFTELPDEYGDEARLYAENNFSYEASSEAFNSIIRRLL